MKNLEFRLLTADEIEIRVGQVTEKGCSLLLYKDARCDMNILDETVGALNWQRGHSRDNANCAVLIWDEEKAQWISKEDTGVESFTEKEKGLASDSFKRACVNWGIGRELYTAPFIWVPAKDIEIAEKNGKKTVKTSFTVVAIGYDEKRRIQHLVICDEKKKKTVYAMGEPAAPPQPEEEVICKACGNPVKPISAKGKTRTPREIADRCGGCCYECYKKGKSEE